MAKYIYTGATKAVGRFGELKRGDKVEFTLREERYIQENEHPDFVPDDGKTKIEATDLPIPEGFDKLSKAEQAKILKQLQSDEDQRRAQLAKANEATDTVNFTDMTKDELLGYAEKLRAGGIKVEFKKDANRKAIINAILAAEGKQPHGEDGDNESPDETTEAKA